MLRKEGGASGTREETVRVLGTMVSPKREGFSDDVAYFVGRSSQSATEFKYVTIIHRQSATWNF